MLSTQPNKNTSKEFSLKKEFIDLQNELKAFIDETSIFTLSDIIKDPLAVHLLDDYINAYKELDDIKKTKKTLKKLLKYKKRNVNLLPFLQQLQATAVANEGSEQTIYKKPTSKIHFPEGFEFKNSLFTLQPFQPQKDISKEKIMRIFKNSISRMDNIKRLIIVKPVVTRSFSVSSSHSHLLKKIEKGNEKGTDVVQKTPPQQKMGNEITTTASFRNGVLKNLVHNDKSMSPNSFAQPNIVKATRSPHQTNNNTKEQQTSPVLPKKPEAEQE